MSPRTEAQATLARCNIPLGASYLTLKPPQVTALLAEIERRGWTPPARFIGSKARYFHEMTQHEARP